MGQTTVTIHGCRDLVDLVRACRSDSRPIVDYGRAHTGLGHPPPEDHVRLVQEGGVIEHDQRDLVVRVAGGATVSRVQAALAATGQSLPVDADGDLTVSEVIQHNVYGPWRLGYGSVKEVLLGIRFVDGLGADVHAGGRTIKNVAGYDLTRFMVGSLGELGCVYEAIFRTIATPPEEALIVIRIPDPARLDGALTGLLGSDAAPAGLSLTMHGDTGELWVGYRGTVRECRSGIRALEAWLDRVKEGPRGIPAVPGAVPGGVPGAEVIRSEIGPGEDLIASGFLEGWAGWRRRAAGVVKILVPPAQTCQTCQRLAAWASQTGCPLRIEALPVHGCALAGGDLDVAAAKALDRWIGDAIGPEGVRLWYARPQQTVAIEPFGPPQADWPVLRQLKGALDPYGLFNPGRFLPPVEVTDR